jgi:hypothetical protein
MTIQSIIQKIQDKPFYSESFFGEVVYLTNQIEVRSTESTSMELLNGEEDFNDLVKDYVKTYGEDFNN